MSFMNNLNRFQEFIVAVTGAGFALLGTWRLVTSSATLQNLGLVLGGIFMVVLSQTLLKAVSEESK